MNTQKIHFINRVDDENVGDAVCSPLSYYYNFFKDYNIIRHDIDHINWIEISRYDVIIIGGSGMLYVTEEFQKNINKLLDICLIVIAWSVGFNTHSGRPINNQVDTYRFKLIGIRDYLHPSRLDYLPCVSCLAAELDKVLAIKRHIGIIDHKYFPVNSSIQGERINNSQSFQDITDFIASSEIIISSSYHNIFWAVLMGKKAICANPFSTKFDFFRYKPVFYSGDLEKDIALTQTYPNSLSESRELNDVFFEKVKKIVQSKITDKNKNYQNIYETTIPALLRRRHEDLGNKFMSVLEEKNNYLLIEINRIHEENNHLHNEINHLHEDINHLHEENKRLYNEIDYKTSLRYFAKKVKQFLKKILKRNK